MLRTRCTRRHKEATEKLITLACVLLGGPRDELDREWCVRIGGDQTMGGAGSAFRFTTYAHTHPLNPAKQQELQVR